MAVALYHSVLILCSLLYLYLTSSFVFAIFRHLIIISLIERWAKLAVQCN